MTEKTENLGTEPLFVSQIAENVALSRSVGWLDDEAEWRALYATANVLGVREAVVLIAQGALGRFEPHAGTIAKMVVAPSAQRRGLGGKILDELIESATRSGLTTLGLVATPFGQPLYASRGFEVAGEVAVFLGQPKLDRAPSACASANVEDAIGFERRFVSCSRADMLRARFREANATAACFAANGELTGFAIATSKATHTVLGPIFAADEDGARELVRSIIAAISGPIRLDVPASQVDFCRWLRELGFPEPVRRPEMSRGGILPWLVPERFALATQAWG